MLNKETKTKEVEMNFIEKELASKLSNASISTAYYLANFANNFIPDNDESFSIKEMSSKIFINEGVYLDIKYYSINRLDSIITIDGREIHQWNDSSLYKYIVESYYRSHKIFIQSGNHVVTIRAKFVNREAVTRLFSNLLK